MNETRWIKRLKALSWVSIYLVVLFTSQVLALQILVGETIRERACTATRAMEIVLQSRMPVLFAMSAIIGLPVLYILILMRRISWTDMIMQRPIYGRQLIRCLGAGMVLNLLFTMAALLLQGVFPQGDAAMAVQRGTTLMGAELNIHNLLLLMAAMGIIIPIYEEVVFRGLIFQELTVCLPIGWAMFLQAAIFAGLHEAGYFRLFPIVLGFLSGLIFLRHKSIWPSCALHCGYNIGSLLLQALAIWAGV